MTTEPLWLIWSMEHHQWWRPAQHGYTPDRRMAGRYSFEEALAIVRNANYYLRQDPPNEAMIREECLSPEP